MVTGADVLAAFARIEALCDEADRERTTWHKGKESKPWHIGYVDVRHIREALYDL